MGIAIFELGKGLKLSPKNKHFTMFTHVLTSTISGSQILSLGTVMFSIPATLAIHLNLVRKGITGAVGCDRSNWKSWTHWLETIWAS